VADLRKYVVIATGGMIGETLDFSPMARAWMVHLVNKWNRKPEFVLPMNVVFVHFDYEAGKVSVYEHAFPLKGKKKPSLKNGDWTELADPRDDFKKIEISTQDNNANQTKTLSITNAYSSIRQLPPGLVLDFSIFSHAYVKGPVLINTTDTEDVAGGSSNRTVKDMDGRARTDFNQNMGEASAGSGALGKFVAAFDPNGHFRVFGCNVQDVVGTGEYKRSAVFQVIHQAYNKPVASGSALGKKLRNKKVPTDPLTLDIWEEMINEAERDANKAAKEDPGVPAWRSMSVAQQNAAANNLLKLHRNLDVFFYPEPSGNPAVAPQVKQIDRFWGDIEGLVARKISESYIFKAAQALAAHGVTCHGAPPGVGGNNEEDKRSLGLMRVCAVLKEFGCDDSFAPWLKYYQDFFFVGVNGVPMKDAFDDRHYVRYNGEAVNIVDNKLP
jgi:hypothetical protein